MFYSVVEELKSLLGVQLDETTNYNRRAWLAHPWDYTFWYWNGIFPAEKTCKLCELCVQDRNYTEFNLQPKSGIKINLA